MAEFKLRVTFFHPFHIVPWRNRADRKTDKHYARGGHYALWHKIDDDTGKPYLAGSMVRSVMLTELEKILGLGYNPYKCCAADDISDSDLQPPSHKRRRRRFFTNTHPCSKNAPCPLCLIKGRYDDNKQKRRREKPAIDAYSVHFSNLDIVPNRSFKWHLTVRSRICNRIDLSSGVARDYRKIYEIYPSTCNRFEGVVNLNITKPEILSQIQETMAVALASITVLAGAGCGVDIISPARSAEC